MKRYVGITGFVSRDEVDFALSVLPEGLTLMCGVLVSEKTLRGERNKWWKRYAWSTDIASIFSPDPRCLNLIHYCSDVAPSPEVVSRLQALGGGHCHGFQFNGAYPERGTLAALKGCEVVLQLRNDGEPGTKDRLRAAVGALSECSVRVLIDGSGGRGVFVTPAICDVWAAKAREWCVASIGLGFAGGLDADSLSRIATEVRTWGASIDAEGRLRDGDEGGSLNFEKVRAYLAAAGEMMAPETGEQR